ncbi:hypothetical protein CA236_17575 [Sphingomonas sp. ABOLG]|nr:hypothetical protein CA236_17575 [Sphingomonas sp. ABOLG]
MRRLDRGEDAERADDHLRIARENGEKIAADLPIPARPCAHSHEPPMPHASSSDAHCCSSRGSSCRTHLAHRQHDMRVPTTI